LLQLCSIHEVRVAFAGLVLRLFSSEWKHRIIIVAVKEILAGEQIFVNYNTNICYDESSPSAATSTTTAYHHQQQLLQQLLLQQQHCQQQQQHQQIVRAPEPQNVKNAIVHSLYLSSSLT
jgi:hypothetical protein